MLRPPTISYTITPADSDTYSGRNGVWVTLPSDNLTLEGVSFQSAGAPGSPPTPSFQGTATAHEMKWNLTFAGKTTEGAWHNLFTAHDHPVQGEQSNAGGAFNSVDADKSATQEIVTVLPN